MYLQTPKRPNLPSTPSYKLPPFSSLLSKELPPPIIKPRLPSIDTLPTPITNYKFNSITPPEESDVSNDSFNDTFQELKPKIKKRKSSNDSEKSFAFISHSPATYPSQEPSIDNAPLARRKRRRTSPNELSILQQEFEKGSTPNKLRRIEISNKVNMSEKAVQIWFQNKRQSLRKQSNHEKEITELPPTPDTSNYFPIVESTPTKPAFNSSSTPFTKLDIDPIDTSSLNNNLVLNNTKKKQPDSLNSINSQTMTFKLAPAKVATPNLLNKLKLEERSPLKEINLNKPKKDNECIENLLSLKTGNWK